MHRQRFLDEMEITVPWEAFLVLLNPRVSQAVQQAIHKISNSAKPSRELAVDQKVSLDYSKYFLDCLYKFSRK